MQNTTGRWISIHIPYLFS